MLVLNIPPADVTVWRATRSNKALLRRLTVTHRHYELHLRGEHISLPNVIAICLVQNLSIKVFWQVQCLPALQLKIRVSVQVCSDMKGGWHLSKVVWCTMHCNSNECWLLILLWGCSPYWCCKLKNVFSAVFFFSPTVVSLKVSVVIKEDQRANFNEELCLRCQGFSWMVIGTSYPGIRKKKKKYWMGDLEILPQKRETFYSWGHRMG